MSQFSIVPSAHEFFKDEIEKISKKHGVTLETPVVIYLTEVLTKFSTSKEFKLSHPATPDKTVSPTEFWLEVQSLPIPQQMISLQYLGDYALFTTGFFGEHIKKSILDRDYFQALGGQAYYRAGTIQESMASERALNVFFNLSESFKRISEMFSELFDQTLLHNSESSLKLFDKWKSSGSLRLARLLVENGFCLQQNKSKNDKTD